MACMTESCSVVGNIDIEPFVPSLISCIARPEEVSECVHGLAGTTFVQVRFCGICYLPIASLTNANIQPSLPRMDRCCSLVPHCFSGLWCSSICVLLL